jgi:O-antigen ligase
MKRIFALLLVLGVCFAAVPAMAVDWSQYESGRNNIRLEGYQTQPGYAAFYDENEALVGYLYAHSDGNLYWTIATYTDLTSEKLGSNGGEAQVNNTAAQP